MRAARRLTSWPAKPSVGTLLSAVTPHGGRFSPGWVMNRAGPEPSLRDMTTHVLHVEDDTAVADMYRLGLQLAGLNVTTAPKGAAALEAASKSEFDFAILDFQLPDMTGLELLSRLRLTSRPLRTLMLSNVSDPELEREAQRRGAEAWLIKSQTTPPDLVRLLTEDAVAQPASRVA